MNVCVLFVLSPYWSSDPTQILSQFAPPLSVVLDTSIERISPPVFLYKFLGQDRHWQVVCLVSRGATAQLCRELFFPCEMGGCLVCTKDFSKPEILYPSVASSVVVF